MQILRRYLSLSVRNHISIHADAAPTERHEFHSTAGDSQEERRGIGFCSRLFPKFSGFLLCWIWGFQPSDIISKEIKKTQNIQKNGCILSITKASKDWTNATAVARAFQIGDKESKSVTYLQTQIHKDMVQKLRASVRTRGMRQWLTHDLLASEMFNVGWSSGKSGPLIPWQGELTNLADNQLVL